MLQPVVIDLPALTRRPLSGIYPRLSGFALLLLAATAIPLLGCGEGGSSGSEVEATAREGGASARVSAAAASESGPAARWDTLFAGRDLEDWHVHEGLPGEQLSGGSWTVEDGAIVGTQDPPGHGGFLVTDGVYGDFEIALETRLDYPSDSGVFLRVGPEGKSHQVTLDHRPDGDIGAIYLPWTQGMVQPNPDGERLFEKGAWNRVRIRIEGEPARVRCWLNDSLITDFHHTEQTTDGVPREGRVGLQVHSGDSWEAGHVVRFRDVRIRPL